MVAMFELLIATTIILLAFYLLAIISEDFFVPAIDKLATRLNLSSDAAGATLLAMGSSAPELFTSIFAVFGTSGENSDIGAGTIVGSAIFNVLVIVGASAMFKAVKLKWQPVVRDMLFYIISIVLLYVSFRDGVITISEASLFVALYVLYIIAVLNWRKIFPYKDDTNVVEFLEENEVGSLGAFTRRVIGYVIPNSNKYPKLYLASFILSIAAIAGLSHQLVHQVVVIADYFSLNPTFLALTLLAAGTSIPDLIGSIVVAKQGRGDMAVSNAVGSNIFDVLFGLGAPWLVFLLINGGSIPVSTNNLDASVLLLFASVIALLFMLAVRNWKLSHKSGILLIVTYGLYVAYTFAKEVL